MGASHRLTIYNGLLGLGLLGLAVFAWLPNSYFRMVSWPWILVWQGALLLVLVGCLWRLRRFNQPFYRLGFGFDWLAAGTVVCLVVSTAVSSFPLLALQNSLLVVCYLVLLYGLRNSHLSALQLCQGVVWVGAIAAIISLVLWQPTPEMWLSDNFYDALRNRFPLGHHNFTGGYFVLVLPVAAGLTWLHSGWQRWGYGVSSLLIAVALYGSGSRGAWLGGLVLTVFALGIRIFRSRGKARLWTILLSSLVLCLALAVLGSNPRVRSLVPMSGSVPASTSPSILVDGPARDRFFMGQATFNIVKHRPLGLGPGNLGRVYERYRPLATGTGLNQVQQVHNTPLQIVVEVGVGGLVVYLGFIVCLVRLVYQLQSLPQDRQLSFGAACGVMGYGVSSLSDYQLENIPIAVTLSVLLVALSLLGGSLKAPAVLAQVSQVYRRWGSLLLLTIAALSVQFWLRSDLSLWMTHQGLASISQGELSRADDKFYTAANLSPWDPTPSALGAQQLEELAKTATNDNQEILQEEAINLYKQALQAAPNDIWFNQNLAFLAWQVGDLATAQSALSKVVQLSPRSQNYSYYLLGLVYQAMGDTEAAIDAFALECLINPQVLTFESWQQELAAVKKPAFARALQHYQTVLSAVEPNHPLRRTLEEHIITLRWWSDESFQPQTGDVERLLLQALFILERNLEQASPHLDRCIAEVSSQDVSACRLLKAWSQPAYLTDYLQSADLDSAEQGLLRSHIATYRSLKEWLQSSTQPILHNQRVALALLYRSYYAQKISSILMPENIRQFSLPTSLNLFSLRWPREFSPLDNLIESIRTETLGLPHPTRNNFQLTSPSDSKPF